MSRYRFFYSHPTPTSFLKILSFQIILDSKTSVNDLAPKGTLAQETHIGRTPLWQRTIQAKLAVADMYWPPRHVRDFDVTQASAIREISRRTILQTASDHVQGSAISPARIW
jgi:hypothetical protein